MKNKLNWVKNNKKYFYVGIPVLLVVLFFVLKGGDAQTEFYTVESENIEQSVKLSGAIETSDKADLGFASSGRIARILVKNNQNVLTGQTLAQLEIGELVADLRIKQLNSKTSDVDLEDARKELEQITKEENTRVASAYRKMLSEDLELIPSSSTYDVEAPVVTGSYNGSEGQYKLNIQTKGTEIKLLTYNLEKGEIIIEEEGPTKLGTKGLYVSFPDNIEDYDNTIWYLDIPNKSSSSYSANFSAYSEAKEARDLAVQNAEFEYQKLLTEEGNGTSSVAQAEIDKINAEIRKNTIYAPFAGIVTNIEKEVGENASTGERVVSMLGEEKLEVVLQVSELDVSRISPGMQIKILIDAIPGEEFSGILKTVNSRETEIEGVPVYEAFVELNADPRIKTGMSASGTVVLATKENVVAIPNYLVKKLNGENFVEVLSPKGKLEDRAVTLGLTGSDSMVEIISGLAVGDKVATPKE